MKPVIRLWEKQSECLETFLMLLFIMHSWYHDCHRQYTTALIRNGVSITTVIRKGESNTILIMNGESNTTVIKNGMSITTVSGRTKKEGSQALIV